MNAIEITELKYRYHDGTEALRGISFRRAPGECIALLGPNGSGKSTLLLHLNGLLPEKLGGDGAVKISGEPVGPKNLEKIRRQVGLVFQDPDDQLFCPDGGGRRGVRPATAWLGRNRNCVAGERIFGTSGTGGIRASRRRII